MIRTQIQLDEAQYKRLRALALERSKSVSQLVREGVIRVLREAERERRWERLWQAVGSCHDRDKATNVAEDHDAYLNRIYLDA